MSYRHHTSSHETVEQAIVVDGRTVHVLRKPIKNLYLRMRPADMGVVVSAPLTMSLAGITAFAHSHHGWIAQQENRLRDRAGDVMPRWNDALRSEATDALNAALPPLLTHWEPVIGRSPSHITLRVMTSRWGSCTPRTGRIRLNLQLGMMDRRLLEYVLVHEMTHLWVGGHGPDFQRHMDRYMPCWRSLRVELNQQSVWR